MQYTSKVQGRNFRSAAERAIFDDLTIADPITLEREPDNPFDENAIKVFARGAHIGYIEREVASFLAYELDKAHVFTVKVDRFESSDKTRKHRSLERCIYLLITDDLTPDSN